MDTLFIALRGYVIFVAASGFIFGQVFFNNFSWGAMLAGIFGIISGVFGGKFSHKNALRSKMIISCCILSLCGVSLDAYNYYGNLASSSGSYYAWFMIVPFCFALLLIIWNITKNMPSNKAFKRDSDKHRAPYP